MTLSMNAKFPIGISQNPYRMTLNLNEKIPIGIPPCNGDFEIEQKIPIGIFFCTCAREIICSLIRKKKR